MGFAPFLYIPRHGGGKPMRVDLAQDKPLETDQSSPDLVNVYLNQMGRWKLLPDPEQVKLFKQLEKLGNEIAKLSKKKKSAGAKAEIKKQQESQKKIKDTLLAANLRLVVYLSKKYLGHGLE